MMILGFAGVGFMAYCRRKVAAIAAWPDFAIQASVRADELAQTVEFGNRQVFFQI